MEEHVLDPRREHLIGPLRLAALDRATGEPVRRYERSRPGELVHLDAKKLGRIPDGGDDQVLGRTASSSHKDRRNGPR